MSQHPNFEGKNCGSTIHTYNLGYPLTTRLKQFSYSIFVRCSNDMTATHNLISQYANSRKESEILHCAIKWWIVLIFTVVLK